MKKFLIVFLSLLFVLLDAGCSRHSERIIGIKIYEYDKDFNQLVSKWKVMGINTAFISTELAANNEFRQLLKENRIGVYIIFPVFYNPEFLKHDSSFYAITDKGMIAKDDWVEFVCPSRISYRKMIINQAADLVTDLHPDGLSIDFIRQFVFWEMIYPDRTAGSIDMACFCDSCVRNFSRFINITIPDTCSSTKLKAAYIKKFYSAEWNDYRSGLIASMAGEIADKVRGISPGIKINIHAVPWRDKDFENASIRIAAQDLTKISAFADYISPMCYSQMLRRDASWIESVVKDMDKKAPGMILPSIQVYPYYIDDPFTMEDFRECCSAALKPPSRGVVFFSWPLFEKDSSRMEII